jgi:hypothetical protein
MSEAQRLAQQFARYFVVNSGTFLPFTDATDGLTAAQALHVPREKFNCIWGVVNHVCYWQEAAMLIIQGSEKKPETLGGDKGGWHSPEQADDAGWLALRARTIDMNAQLANAVAALNDEQLHTVLSAWNSSPYEMTQSLLAHNSYHTCEIISLRHLQGLWVNA